MYKIIIQRKDKSTNIFTLPFKYNSYNEALNVLNDLINEDTKIGINIQYDYNIEEGK